MLKRPHQQQSSLRLWFCTFQCLPFPCSPSFPTQGMPEGRRCHWIRSIAPSFAKRQPAQNMPADRSVLRDLAAGIGTVLRFGKTAWHETCVCVRDAIYGLCNSGIKILSLSPSPLTFHYVRNNQNMTFSIFNLSETECGLWSVTQNY